MSGKHIEKRDISKHNNRLTQKEIDKDRVRRYLNRNFGKNAFFKNGKIKLSSLIHLKKNLKNSANSSLKEAVNDAINLKRYRMRE